MIRCLAGLLIIFGFNICAIDWQSLIDEKKGEFLVVENGASNFNYRFCYEGKDYFIRLPNEVSSISGDMQIEYEVLKQLDRHSVAPKPLYFDKNKKILVVEFLPSDGEEIDLKDPLTRKSVVDLLGKIDGLDVVIDRLCQPYHDTFQYVEQIHALGLAMPASFYEEMLPALEKIDQILTASNNKKLCHLDLHHRNLLKSTGQFYLIDWEYAAMGDPLLNLGSMASIERWDDLLMKDLLADYRPGYQLNDFYRLYLCRIFADIRWSVWNHLQTHLSTLPMPYETWERLFYESALERIRSPIFQKAIEVL